ncbi:MAG TPA: SDR family NAD(P)-dependent oxidoreductase [Ohtaekwangia sp.]|nr:SDR family NAD(P)-dependent oxidoreductase [Ohtaekwangia sp.]
MKKVVLITGASGNLGKAAVERFIAEGYHIVATVTPGKSLNFAAEQVEEVEVNLTNEVMVQDVIRRVLEKHSAIHAALLLAGGYASGNVHSTDGDTLKKMWSSNFETAYYITRPLFEHMLSQNGGRIVFVGARPALQPADGKKSLAYALSKSLLFNLAEILNAEGAEKNVVTAVIVPSTIDTPQNRAAMPKADFSRWVKPEDIANVLAFAVSSDGILREPVFKVYGKT